MPEHLPEVLFPLRPRRDTDPRLSSVGKQSTGPASETSPEGGKPDSLFTAGTPGPIEPTTSRIRYLPRPTLQISMLGHTLEALLDTGSQLSCVNGEIRDWARKNGLKEEKTGDLISLVDGTDARPVGTLRIPFSTDGMQYEENFTVLPRMTRPVLLGIYTIAALRLSRTPPPEIAVWPIRHPTEPCLQLGLRKLTEDEETEFERFLGRELTRFETVTGRTTHVQHRLKLTDESPIK